MNQARAGHTMTLMGNKVLILGGYVKGKASNSGEIYDIRTKRFTKIRDKLFIPRGNHTVTAITDNKAYIVGGFTDGKHGVSLVESFDMDLQSFEELDLNLTTKRGDHSALKLNDRSILVVGGASEFRKSMRTDSDCPRNSDGENLCLESMEIIDLYNENSTQVSKRLQIPRAGYSFTVFGETRSLSWVEIKMLMII